MKHIPALDGIRGIAILLVMLFHLHLPGLSLGWAGVPLFFVLSGFLITQILLDEKSNSLYDYLRSFYIKRTLRIFPLFYAYLLINFLLLLATGKSTDGLGWYALYLQNYHIGIALDNKDAYIPGVVGHTWSLAVEEQFYLIWPFLVYFLNRRTLAWVCVILIIAAPITRLVILQNGHTYLANVTLPSCMDMMAYGALLALVRSSEVGSKIAYSMFFLGSTLVTYAIIDIGTEAFWTPETWANSAFYLYTALSFAFGIVIWTAAVKPNTYIVRALTIKPLLFTGKISYGLYIWHLVIFIVIEKIAQKFHFPASQITIPVVSMLLSYLVSIVSFNFFEIHFLQLKEKFAPRRN